MTEGAAAPERQAGSWNRRVVLLAGPIILSNLSTPLLGAADTAVVGHLPDPTAIGGVGIGAVVFSFLFWGFGFLRMGTTGFTAQAFGAGDAAELRVALLRPLLLGVALGGLIVLLQGPIGALAFGLFHASEAVEAQAGAYFEVRIWAAPATLVNYAILGWLLGLRRANTALVLQVVLNGLNIVLDLLFVVGLGWDIRGVALASVIAEIAAALLGLAIVLRLLRGRPEAAAGIWQRVWQRDGLVALVRVNLDLLVRTLTLIFAFAYFTDQSARLGDLPLAGNAILLQFQKFIAYGLDGFAHAAEILAGNAKGAGDRRGFRQAVRVCGLWGLGLAAVLAALLLAGGPGLIALFTSHQDVREVAQAFLPWLVLSPLVSVWSFLLDGIFIGTTRSAALRNAMLLSLAAYLPACWLLVPWLGNHGLWLALTLFMVVRAVTLGCFYPALDRSIGDRSIGARPAAS